MIIRLGNVSLRHGQNLSIVRTSIRNQSLVSFSLKEYPPIRLSSCFHCLLSDPEDEAPNFEEQAL